MTSEPRRLVIELPPGLELLNANDRRHYRDTAQKGEKIRSEAYRIAKESLMTFGKVRIRCIFRAPDNRRRDTANLYPSWKFALDGAVSAGVLKDDNDKYVLSFEMLRGENRTDKKSQLILEIIEVEE